MRGTSHYRRIFLKQEIKDVLYENCSFARRCAIRTGKKWTAINIKLKRVEFIFVFRTVHFQRTSIKTIKEIMS